MKEQFTFYPVALSALVILMSGMSVRANLAKDLLLPKPKKMASEGHRLYYESYYSTYVKEAKSWVLVRKQSASQYEKAVSALRRSNAVRKNKALGAAVQRELDRLLRKRDTPNEEDFATHSELEELRNTHNSARKTATISLQEEAQRLANVYLKKMTDLRESYGTSQNRKTEVAILTKEIDSVFAHPATTAATLGAQERAKKAAIAAKKMRYKKSAYEWVTGPVSWHDAVKKAKEMGGKLAILETKSEYQFLAGKLKMEPGQGIWIGASDQVKSKEHKTQVFLKWTNGKPLENIKKWIGEKFILIPHPDGSDEYNRIFAMIYHDKETGKNHLRGIDAAEPGSILQGFLLEKTAK